MITRIRSKLLLVFVLISVLPLIGSGYIAVDKSKQAIQHEVENTLNTIADYKVLQIQKYFDHQESLGQVLAKSPLIKSVMRRLPEAFYQGIENPEYRDLDAEIRNFLDLYRTEGGFEDVYLISDEADIVFSLQRKPDFATNLLDGPYESSAIAYAFDLALTMRGTKFIGFQSYSAANNDYAAFLATPVMSEGRALGVIAFQIPIDVVYRFSSDYTGLKNTGEVMLAKQEFDRLVLVSPLRHDDFSTDLHYLELKQDEESPLLQATKGNSSSGRFRDYRKQDVIAAWRYLPRLHWGMLVKIDEAEAYEAERQLETYMVLLGIACLITVLVIGLVFSRGLSLPITRLAAATKKIEAGELDYQVKVSSLDEIGQLGHSFNSMTQKLKSSLDQAQSAVVAKSQFLTTMSHEIRTPMNGVLGMSQLLEDTKLDEEQKEYVKIINESGKGLLNIINDILEYSKLDDGVILEVSTFDLEQIAQQCLDAISTEASRKGIDLIFDYQVRSPRLLIGDVDRIKRVIGNLLNNAVKFTESGYVSLSISVSTGRSGNALVNIDVEDTGIGIEADKMDKLFDTFTQIDQSISRRYGGTGLGLSMCRKIVELIGGEISIESSYGEGSCFRVSLSLMLDHEAGSNADLQPVGDVNVLLIDHNPVSACSIHNFLDALEASVTTISDFDAVVQALNDARPENPYQLLMIHTAGKLESALQLVDRIYRQEKTGRLRTILYAPLAESAGADAFQELGVDVYLSKFYSQQQIRDIIVDLLGDTSALRAGVEKKAS